MTNELNASEIIEKQLKINYFTTKMVECAARDFDDFSRLNGTAEALHEQILEAHSLNKAFGVENDALFNAEKLISEFREILKQNKLEADYQQLLRQKQADIISHQSAELQDKLSTIASAETKSSKRKSVDVVGV